MTTDKGRTIAYLEGIGGTGKSQLAVKLAKRMGGIYVESITDDVSRDQLEDNDGLIMAELEHFGRLAKIIYQNPNTNIICDRSVVTYQAYGEIYGTNTPELDSISRYLYNKANIIFFIHPNKQFPVEDDGRRYTNVEDLEKLHKVFDKLFGIYIRTRNVPIVHLDQNDFYAMENACVNWIEYIRGKK